ncbi:hypothetical protein [Azospirillum brasilense]|nr:hypothetical protein [Azospirillum brasilense]
MGRELLAVVTPLAVCGGLHPRRIRWPPILPLADNTRRHGAGDPPDLGDRPERAQNGEIIMISSDDFSRLKENSEFRDDLFSFLDQFKRTIISVEQLDRNTAEQIYDAMKAVAELAELYNLIAQHLAKSNGQILQTQSLEKFAGSFEAKARGIASVVRGTRLEWQKTAQNLNKGRFIGIDLDKDNDPDMRVHYPNSNDKAKVIEFKSTSGTENTINENIKSQLNSAIFQLCKRSVDYNGVQFVHRKLNAVVEINYSQDMLKNMIMNNGAFGQDNIYDYFSNIISSSWSRGKIGKEEIFPMVENNKLGWKRNVPPKIVQLPDHPAQFIDATWGSMFQIDFTFKPYLKVRVNRGEMIWNSFGREAKFLVYFCDDNGTKTIALHRVMMMKSSFELNGQLYYNLYDSGREMSLRTFP